VLRKVTENTETKDEDHHLLRNGAMGIPALRRKMLTSSSGWKWNFDLHLQDNMVL
jgi:hypothetical protein